MTPYRRVLSMLDPVLVFFRRNITDALRVCAALFKVMIPVIIVVRLLQEAGLVTLLGEILSPAMQLFGLPGPMSLVWATAMLTNLYTGALILITLLPENPMTAAQVTVLTTMMLIAHALPVELGVARRSGARLRAQFILRVGGAILCGWLLHQGYSLLGWGTASIHPSWVPDAPPAGWIPWAIGEVRNLTGIAVIILVLMMLLDILKRLGITDLMIRLLSPLLKLMGVGREAGTIAIVGLTLGLSYGGGLIIHEARSGRIPPQGHLFRAQLHGTDPQPDRRHPAHGPAGRGTAGGPLGAADFHNHRSLDSHEDCRRHARKNSPVDSRSLPLT